MENKKNTNDELLDIDVEKVTCIMIQGKLGNVDKLVDFGENDKKVAYEFLHKLETMGVEFFGTSIKYDSYLELDGILTYTDRFIPFNMESFKNMVLGNGLTFEGRYALAKYNPDDDNLDLETQK